MYNVHFRRWVSITLLIQTNYVLFCCFYAHCNFSLDLSIPHEFEKISTTQEIRKNL